MDKNCLNCHFLGQRVHNHPIHGTYNMPVPPEAREKALEESGIYYIKRLQSDLSVSLFCHRKNWDEERSPWKDDLVVIKENLLKKRSNCFFEFDSNGLTIQRALEIKTEKEEDSKKVKVSIRAGVFKCAKFFSYPVVLYIGLAWSNSLKHVFQVLKPFIHL